MPLEGAIKFEQLGKVVQNLTVLIPIPVVGDYIRYNFEVLKSAEGLFATVEKYADRIMAEVENASSEWQKAQSSENSYLNYHLITKNPKAVERLMDVRQDWR